MTTPDPIKEHRVPLRASRGGPHNLGDPEDKSLRRVETEVLIPKKIREIAKVEKCIQEVADFNKCCKASNFAMVLKCRKENAALWGCMTHWYDDVDFREQCTNEYLAERTHYRATGIGVKKQKKINQEHLNKMTEHE